LLDVSRIFLPGEEFLQIWILSLPGLMVRDLNARDRPRVERGRGCRAAMSPREVFFGAFG